MPEEYTPEDSLTEREKETWETYEAEAEEIVKH